MRRRSRSSLSPSFARGPSARFIRSTSRDRVAVRCAFAARTQGVAVSRPLDVLGLRRHTPTAPACLDPWTPLHAIHMKRTNLVLREDLLREAVHLSGEKTYSRAVEIALEDFVRRAKARKIL